MPQPTLGQSNRNSGSTSPSKINDDSDGVARNPVEKKNLVNLNENESWFTTFRIQVVTLMWKNWVIFTRKIQILAFAVLTPPLVIWMMLLLQGVGTNLEDFGHTDSAIHGLDEILPCESGTELALSDWVSTL